MLKKKITNLIQMYFFTLHNKRSQKCSSLKLEEKSHEPNTYGMYNM